MCGSVPNHWELIDGHGRNSERWGETDVEEHKGSHHDDKDTERWNEDYQKKYKGSHHDNKDAHIGFVVGLIVGGILGGIMVAVICLACRRKRVWVAAPPAVGNSVHGRPITDEVKQTHVVVGAIVERGQVPTAQKTSNVDANVIVIADLEHGA